MVHFRREINVQVSPGTSQTITISPSQLVSIDASGNGSLTITFAVPVPQSLSSFVTSSNTVTIPVIGKVSLVLSNVSKIVVSGALAVKIDEQVQGILVTPSQIKIDVPSFSNISVSVSNNSIASVTIDGQPVGPVNVINVGFEPITFVGSGVSFSVQDYDPITGLPVGQPVAVNLPSGTSESEYPTGSQILSSRTGYIIITNVSGSGYFYIFKVKPPIIMGLG
jgi:hypothetical protein